MLSRPASIVVHYLRGDPFGGKSHFGPAGTRLFSRLSGEQFEASLDAVQFFFGQFLDVQQCVGRHRGTGIGVG